MEEKYQITIHNEKTGILSKVNTSISKDLIEGIEKLFKKFDNPNFSISPLMVDPNDNMSIKYAVIEKTDHNTQTLAYFISIRPNKK